MTMHKLGFVFIIFSLLGSCSNSAEMVEMKPVNGVWNKKTEHQFDFKITDAQNPKNIIFVVRNNNDYPYSNIRLFVNFSANKKSDTLNYILARPDGEWIGKGFGETKETLFQYKLNYKFPKNGDYSLGIKQAMRADQLKGIEDIGIKIETAKP